MRLVMGGSGVARITYRIGKKGKLQRYRKPFTIRARKLKDLHFGAVDKAGNREKLKAARRSPPRAGTGGRRRSPCCPRRPPPRRA